MTKKWTKDEALQELQILAETTNTLSKSKRFSAEHVQWIDRVIIILEEVFGRNSRYYATFTNFHWSVTGSLLVGGPMDPEGSWNPQKSIEKKHHIAYLQDLESAHGLLIAAYDYLQKRDLILVYEGKNTIPESSEIFKIINLVEFKIRKMIRKKPDIEIEIQEALENLLVGADIQYSREAEKIEYSSKTYIPDFTLPKIDLIIEIKLCNKSTREKEIIAEINDDILAYQTKYGNLLFVVYDTGFIRDIERFVTAFEKSQNIVVKVVKH